ncbi:hypothetical protein KAJ83_02320 [Marivibrio halodurans]|uniref:PH domain-containing protein n=1 Tax=Marivibrio halodurans TaxID=2039722 RepID=A0A8J7RW79_9PROT|nr:hypothetical protein [Marivibrio halodurans]MBP5855827.1 hypothetical protein [Marivibrio halodurans]
MPTPRMPTPPNAPPPGMVKGVGVPGRWPRTHAPEGWPGPVDFPIDPGRNRRNGITILIFAAVGGCAYFALGGGAVLGWIVALVVVALIAGSLVRVQGDASALRFTREGMEFVGTRPPKRHRWDEISGIDPMDIPWGLPIGHAKRGQRVVRVTLKPRTRYGQPDHEVVPAGPGVDADGLAQAIEGWWRYATRPW